MATGQIGDSGEQDCEVVVSVDIPEIPEHIKAVCAKAKEVKEIGGQVLFKYTCLHCGSRQTFAEENKLYVEGQCEECKGITNLFDERARVGFAALITIGAKLKVKDDADKEA